MTTDQHSAGAEIANRGEAKSTISLIRGFEKQIDSSRCGKLSK